MNKVAIHQPNFVPWLGYFYKIHYADIFIFLDNVQVPNRGFANRNKIKTLQNTSQWLTVPLKSAPSGYAIYNDAMIDYEQKWQNKQLKTLKQNYSKAPFFDLHFPPLEGIINTKFDDLSALNITLINYILNFLEIRKKTFQASQLNTEVLSATERLIKLCKMVEGTHYITGKGGLNYMDTSLFNQSNIQVAVSNFTYPSYNQLGDIFIDNLSILDVIFNCSKEQILRFFATQKSLLE